MMGFGGIELLIFALPYLLVVIFVIWMTIRFVRAHEKIAEGIEEIAENAGNTEII